MPVDPITILPAVIDAVLAAGDLVAAEFARLDGPRFSDHVTAPLDTEIELMLRDRLLALIPARFVGEEAGTLEASTDESRQNGDCWVVDPHDGTRAFLEGKRGSAISVALLRMGTPILAVVYAPTSPDRGRDLISWCMGGRIERNGAVVDIDPRDRDLNADDVVFLNHGAWQRPDWHNAACAPAGFIPLPSIAYRLARIAVGDGIATQTLRPVNALDIAAGHALVMAAGGVLVAEDGVPVTYNVLGESRPSACFGGAPKAVDILRKRPWRGSQEPRREPRITLTWPRLTAEATLDRAMGCLFGLAIGGGLGADVELALAVARSLLGHTSLDNAAIDDAVTGWIDSGGDASRASALARAIPIGIWASDPQAASIAARRDMPDSPAHVALAVAVAQGVSGGNPIEVARLAARFGHKDIVMASPHARRWSSAVSGALAGAAYGRAIFPAREVMRILSARPGSGPGAARPRPDIYWTDDLAELAEALLSQGQRGT